VPNKSILVVPLLPKFTGVAEILFLYIRYR